MEWVKLKIKMPYTLYNQIVSEIKEFDGNEPTIQFKIFKEKDEEVDWGSYSTDDPELWKFTALLQRLSYSSKFNDGTVMAHIECLIQYNDRCSKSELRDLILSELV